MHKPKDLKPAEGHYLPWSKCIMNYNNSVKYNTVFGMSLRLSEAYLILAEAVYNTDEELALRMINELREKRYAEGKNYEVNYSGEELLNFIREERRRELCFEGQRWFVYAVTVCQVLNGVGLNMVITWEITC